MSPQSQKLVKVDRGDDDDDDGEKKDKSAGEVENRIHE